MNLKFKFPLSNVFWVLELNELQTLSKEANLRMAALVTNKKGCFSLSMVSDLGHAPPFKGGVL